MFHRDPECSETAVCSKNSVSTLTLPRLFAVSSSVYDLSFHLLYAHCTHMDAFFPATCSTLDVLIMPRQRLHFL